MTVGERIKRARLKKGYSQTELAELLGYKSRSSINKIEKEGRDVPRSIIVKLAKLLDVTPAHLMGWEETEQEHSTSKNQVELILSSHEKEVLVAYRQQPDMQQAVDKLLGIKTTSIFRAAKSTDNHPPEIVETTKDFSKIPPTTKKL